VAEPLRRSFPRLARMDRPRERLLSRGPRALADEELLAVLLRTGRAGCDVLELSRRILRRFPGGSLAGVPAPELSAQEGIGPVRAASIAAALELARRWGWRREERALLDRPESVWRELSSLRGLRKEHFVALFLDACNRLIQQEVVSVGTLTATLVHPREVFSSAVSCAAAGIIVAHNHPSGDPEPSREDRETTRRLSEAGKILGIPLLDHVVVGECRYFSFRERGLMDA